MHVRRSWPIAPIAVVAILGLSACGSTVASTTAGSPGGLAAAQSSGQQGAAPGSSGTGGVTAPGQPLVGGGAPIAPTTASRSGATAQPGARSSLAGGAAGGAGTAINGVTATTITVGIETFGGYQAAASSFGAGGLAAQTAETRDNAQLMVNYINAHGGILGRKLIAIYHDTNIDSSESFDADEQATCADFTQDHHVFAVMSPEGFDYDTLMSCLAARRTMLLRYSVNVYDQQYAAKYAGLYYAPGDVFGDRWKPFIDALFSTGLLPASSKIGIVRGTWPTEARTAAVLRAALKAHGLSVTDEVPVADETSTANVGNTMADTSGLVLKFRSEGIDHVIFTQGPVFPLGFMTNAESQHYYPHYALTSRANLEFLETNAPQDQVKNMAGITFGGLPHFTLENQATELCKKIGPPNVQNPYCGLLLFFSAVFQHAASASTSGFAAGVRALGSTFSSPVEIATNFGSHHQDGGAGARLFRWNDSCTCLDYGGPAMSVP